MVTIMQMQMQSYKEKLLKLDDENSSELISSGTKERAQALIYQFLSSAKKSVNITSKNLSIYNDYTIVNALNAAINRGVKIKILLDNYQGNGIENNDFLDSCLSNENNESCEIRTYDKPLKAHIVTKDDNAFRYCDNPGSNIAVACFNSPDIVKNATEKVFGTFFTQQVKYSAKSRYEITNPTHPDKNQPALTNPPSPNRPQLIQPALTGPN